jgi:alkylhydroperoxidase family enzyme
VAAAVIGGDDTALTPAEQAMAAWARAVARDPNGTTLAQVQALRDAGLEDAQIFAITAFVALRIAFSTVNDALGVRPDAQMQTTVPEPIRQVVTYGRPIAESARTAE